MVKARNVIQHSVVISLASTQAHGSEEAMKWASFMCPRTRNWWARFCLIVPQISFLVGLTSTISFPGFQAAHDWLSLSLLQSDKGSPVEWDLAEFSDRLLTTWTWILWQDLTFLSIYMAVRGLSTCKGRSLPVWKGSLFPNSCNILCYPLKTDIIYLLTYSFFSGRPSVIP